MNSRTRFRIGFAIIAALVAFAIYFLLADSAQAGDTVKANADAQSDANASANSIAGSWSGGGESTASAQTGNNAVTIEGDRVKTGYRHQRHLSR